ncbi:RNA polymerase I enhancer binding protein [Yamadazyma tenuis]|uniref:DNA-binding protein REB1 n=1 Tax=Candida tenuis (strain ATCC 10573 / BCRC 21748 / CBS 615 / JCM 9827 / NBRC 10315 / NRRL Y-1498 / VKM Y-70) TaxID=590646 RepID=G3B931_CANTC|nr:uncharacterized protein CANTEDRAFT_126446 [Yamadazyma tenuis ATCC 10573]EGV62451.1 hypothetical protein CANTEDRAFT_126446 [Yamadazyma tenuis ATCC 10573]WEJ93734.1 RNA polymerase I enhancer binding protein [Yamadazyma tenuis]
MNNQQEIGGAQALLQLGSKAKGASKRRPSTNPNKTDPESKHQHEEPSSEGHFDHSQTSELEPSGPQDDDIDSKATNQQINDAVEAAVMRYVGGNLDDDKKSKKRLNPDEIISSIGDFQTWSGFLEEGMNDNPDFYDNHNNHNQPTKSPKKKKRRTLSHPSNEIDPELSGLDSNSEHDQLVRAAILETRELAKQLGSTYNTLTNLPAHQAHQVIAALQNNHNGGDSISNINHLVQLAKDQNAEVPNSTIRQFRNFDFKNLESHQNYATTGSYTHIQSVENLSDESQKIAMNWFKDQPQTKGPRPFAPEEQKAVEHFIEGYGYLFKMDRKDICNRIWTTARKKDNFWECLTRVLPYRSRASVYKHVRRQYHIFDVRGKWTSQDDEQLSKLAAVKQGNWKEIGAAMGRMPEDCRDRWRNYIKCGENRVSSKWSSEEEAKLKQVVTEMLTKSKINAINWTLVSEAMEGTRSRIQCRYKWNKLVKKDSMSRIGEMDVDTKLWLFQKIKMLNFSTFKEVDWSLLARMCNEELKQPNKWLPSDFEYGFEKLKSVVKDHKSLTFPELLTQLIQGCHCIRERPGVNKQGSNTDTIDQVHEQTSEPDNDKEYLWR